MKYLLFYNPLAFLFCFGLLFKTVQAQTEIFACTESGQLYSFNALTCNTQLITSTNITLVDLAICPNGSFYGISYASGGLYSIDTTTGVGSLVNSTINSLTLMCDQNNILYFIAGTSLLSYNPSTMAVINLGNTGYFAAGDLVFYQGYFYFTSFDGYLIRLEISGTSITNVVNIGLLTASGYVIGPNSNFGLSIYATSSENCELEYQMFVSNGSRIFEVDPASAIMTNPCPSLGSTIFGCASVAETIPENFSAGQDTSLLLCNRVDTLMLSDLIIGSTSSSGTWESSPVGISNDTLILPIPNGDYVIDYLLESWYCKDTAHIFLTLDSISTNQIPDTSFCENSGIWLEAGETGNGYSYEWQNGLTSDSLYADSSGWYWVDISFANCELRDSIELTFFNTVDIDIIGDTLLCNGDSVTLQAVPSGTFEYEWSTGDSLAVIVIPATSSDYVYLNVTDSNGCPTADSLWITLAPRPNAAIIYDSAACMYDSLWFHALTDSGNVIMWSTGSNASSIILNPSTLSDSIVLTVTNNFGCLDSINFATSSVTLYPTPIALFDTTSLNYLSGYLFTDSSYLNISSWYWNFGDGQTSTLQNPTHFFESSGSYTVSLIVNNEFGCLDTFALPIEIINNQLIPNVFTPNGDGKNDFFIIQLADIKDAVMSIYNRWGLKLHQSAQGQLYWDGRTSSGSEVSDGTYYYVITSPTLSKALQSGYVTLLR